MLFRKFSLARSKNAPFIAGLLASIALSLGVAVGVGGVPTVGATSECADYSPNSIIYSGFSTPSNFISIVKGNNSGNGYHDLQNIYAHYGLEPSDYNQFVTSAEAGTAYGDGRIVVGGQTVATGAKSMGRSEDCQGPNPFRISIDGSTYWGNTNANAFAGGSGASLPVTVLFNAQGAMQFAVLNDCGNPEFGTPVAPSYTCDALNEAAVSGQANTYKFTTNASATNNATLVKAVYDFGDGTTKTVTNLSTPVEHTFTSSVTKSFTVTVTVYVHLPGNQTVTVTSTKCKKVVTVTVTPPKPYASCVQLAGSSQNTSGPMTDTFVVTAAYGNGATFTSADFYFGDGNSQLGVTPSTKTTATYTYTYKVPNTYTAKAILHFNENGKDVTAVSCAAVVSPHSPPTPACKTGVPEGSPACSPCTTDTSLPANQCPTVPPPTLPNTGAGDTIAVFAAVFVVAFLVYRQMLYRKHKAAFVAAERGSSPLPLGDPLSPDQPLKGTPLAHKRRTLRRKRPY